MQTAKSPLQLRGVIYSQKKKKKTSGCYRSVKLHLKKKKGLKSCVN